MNCTNCGTVIQAGANFCPGCGQPAAAGFCPGCGKELQPGAAFCPNCGAKIGDRSSSAPPPSTGPLKAGRKQDLTAGETVLMDTGMFPISYIKNMMTSINGKLNLTSSRLVFKAGALQGVGGVAAGGLFIPNFKDAQKASTNFGIPLADITALEKGWSHVTVTTSYGKFKFGGMRKTGEWEQAIRTGMGQG